MPLYRFVTTHLTPIPDKKHFFKSASVDAEGSSVELAYALAAPQFPAGSRLFCWWEITKEVGDTTKEVGDTTKEVGG